MKRDSAPQRWITDSNGAAAITLSGGALKELSVTPCQLAVTFFVNRM